MYVHVAMYVSARAYAHLNVGCWERLQWDNHVWWSRVMIQKERSLSVHGPELIKAGIIHKLVERLTCYAGSMSVGVMCTLCNLFSDPNLVRALAFLMTYHSFYQPPDLLVECYKIPNPDGVNHQDSRKESEGPYHHEGCEDRSSRPLTCTSHQSNSGILSVWNLIFLHVPSELVYV